uniref:Uncharacterized protein n=1 Tax=Anguilla anguilla TaxID=7936 RepID=A0A0E9UNN2_ANGAN
MVKTSILEKDFNSYRSLHTVSALPLIKQS